MTQVTHSAFSHMNKKQAPASNKGPQVRTVAPPEMESELAATSEVPRAKNAPKEPVVMQDIVSQPIPAGHNGIPGVMDDAAVQANLDRKKIFEKLVLFREDYMTEVEVGGLKFNLKLLNANDNVFVLKQIKLIPADEQVSKLAIMVLAAAIVDINGIKLEDVYSGPPELTEPVMRRYFELNLWHSPITNALSNAYHKFQEEVEKEYTQDFLVE